MRCSDVDPAPIDINPDVHPGESRWNRLYSTRLNPIKAHDQNNRILVNPKRGGRYALDKPFVADSTDHDISTFAYPVDASTTPRHNNK